jgi:enamine deaminase RidA (YjgF/YER057c/UK114 family)
MAGRIDARLKELGITLPDAPAPAANYIPYVVTGKLVFVSGQISNAGGKVIAGKLGRDLDIPAGQQAARACALNLLAQLRAACGGDLDRVTRVIKLGGFVNGTEDFPNPPQVMNGASDLLVEIFDDAGRHARFAIAVACLPSNAAVEVDGVFEIGE